MGHRAVRGGAQLGVHRDVDVDLLAIRASPLRTVRAGFQVLVHVLDPGAVGVLAALTAGRVQNKMHQSPHLLHALLLVLARETHLGLIKLSAGWRSERMRVGQPVVELGLAEASTAHVKVWALGAPIALTRLDLSLTVIACRRECWLAGVVQVVQ